MSYMKVKHLHGTTNGEARERRRVGRAVFEGCSGTPQCPLYFFHKKNRKGIFLSRCENTLSEGKGGYSVAHVNAYYLGKWGRPTTGFVACCGRCNNKKSIERNGGIQFVDETFFVPQSYGYKSGAYTVDDRMRANPYSGFDRIISRGDLLCPAKLRLQEWSLHC